MKKLSEGYDFLEESYGIGVLNYNFLNKDKKIIIENYTGEDLEYSVIGIAKGVFFVPDGYSRNERFYPKELWECTLRNEYLVDRINRRQMLGTIGHHDKLVDDEDLASGIISHVVTELYIDEDTGLGIGTLEIIDTPAGNLLKSYYKSKIPVYVSSRASGHLTKMEGIDIPCVDKNNYNLHTFDIVKDPGFLLAQPEYISNENFVKLDKYNNESIEHIKNQKILENNLYSKKDNNNANENIKTKELENMGLDKIKVELSQDELVKNLVNPVVEGIDSMIARLGELDSKINKDMTALKEDLEKEVKINKELTEKINKVPSVILESADLYDVVLKTSLTESENKISELESVKEELINKISEMETDKELKIAEFSETLEVVKSQIKQNKTTNEELSVKNEELNSKVAELDEILKESNVKLEEALKEIKARDISEEFSITIEEARNLLKEKTYEEIKEEIEKKEKELEDKKDKELEDKKDKEDCKEKELKESFESKLKSSRKIFNRFIK